MFFSSLSSYLFSIVPVLINNFNIPVYMYKRLAILSICSSIYHITDQYLLRKKTNSLLLKISEWFDGSSIILVCNSFIFNNKTNILIDQNLLLFYSITKLVSNVELVKKIIYLICFLKMAYIKPVVSIPFLFGSTGFYNYIQNNKWNHYNRSIWHLGNAIYIGMSMHYLL